MKKALPIALALMLCTTTSWATQLPVIRDGNDLYVETNGYDTHTNEKNIEALRVTVGADLPNAIRLSQYGYLGAEAGKDIDHQNSRLFHRTEGGSYIGVKYTNYRTFLDLRPVLAKLNPFNWFK